MAREGAGAETGTGEETGQWQGKGRARAGAEIPWWGVRSTGRSRDSWGRGRLEPDVKDAGAMQAMALLVFDRAVTILAGRE